MARLDTLPMIRQGAAICKFVFGESSNTPHTFLTFRLRGVERLYRNSSESLAILYLTTES
jgi:hypothetical protein